MKRSFSFQTIYMNKRLLTILQTLGVCILFALGVILMKLGLKSVDAMTLAWLPLAIGMLGMSLYTFGIKRQSIPKKLDRKIWVYIIIIGVCNFTISRMVKPFALETMPANTYSYLTQFQGFVTMALSIAILREVPTIWQLVGAAVAFGGLRLFFLQVPSTAEWLGIILIAVAWLATAYTNNATRKVMLVTHNGIDNNVFSTLTILIGGIAAVVIGLSLGGLPHVPDLASWGVIFYLGLVWIAFNLTAWNYFLRTLRSYEASILSASVVIFTALLSLLILGEKLALNQVYGILTMIVGLALVQVRRGRLDVLWQRLFKHEE
jgi:O-acetylserine/cysteine efflux transporter